MDPEIERAGRGGECGEVMGRKVKNEECANVSLMCSRIGAEVYAQHYDGCASNFRRTGRND